MALYPRGIHAALWFNGSPDPRRYLCNHQHQQAEFRWIHYGRSVRHDRVHHDLYPFGLLWIRQLVQEPIQIILKWI